MGLLNFLLTKKSAKVEAAADAAAWVTDVTAALPGAQVSVDSWAGRRYSDYGVFNTYTVQIRGNRSEFPAMVGRLASSIDALRDGDRLNLQIAESEAPGAVYSRLLLAGENRERSWVHFLVQAHDALAARIPGESLLIDGVSGRFTVMAVSRGEAARAARTLISWWEDLLVAELERWTLAGLSLEIGGGHDDPEISYTVDLPGSFDADGVDLDEPAAPLSPAEKRERIQLGAAAWTGSLGDLATAATLDLRSGHSIEIQFLPPGFEPHLLVLEQDTGVWNKEETARIGEAIKSRNPASVLRTP